jgi:ABC-2 type transport system permease protein
MTVKTTSGKYLKFLVYLLAIVLINAAGMTLFFRVDMTGNKIFSISAVSRKVVSSLSEPLTIKVFFTKNLPAPHNNTERYLHDLLEEYAVYANHYFNYRFYDVSPEGGDMSKEARENQELARNYGIHPVQIQAIEKDEIKFQKAYMGLVLIHGDLIERIPTITSTDGLEYELTTAIQKLNDKISTLLSLKGKIQVKLFLSSSLDRVAPFMKLDHLADLPQEIEKIVKKLNNKNYGKLEFEYLDPSKNQNLGEELKKYNLLTLKWPALADGKVEAGSGTIGLVMEYGNKVAEMPLIRVLKIPLLGTHYEMADLESMENTLDENVESLIDINEDLGYLSDHGTLKLYPDSPGSAEEEDDVVSNFRTLESQGYTLKGVDLKEHPIPESLKCLVIAGPTENFTDYELFQIDQFLMEGKNLAIFLDAYKEVMPPTPQGMPPQYNQGPRYMPLNTGLEKLLEHYGVRIKKSYLLDENCFHQQVPAQLGGGERPIYFAPLIKNRFINNDLGFMKNIKGLVALKISPLELDQERVSKNGLKAYRLFASSDKSWEMSGRINLNPMLIQPPKSGEEKGSFPLAYLLEGEFPSYFAGKPLPEKKVAEGEKDKGEKDNKDKPPSKEKKVDVDLAKIKGEGAFLAKGKPGRIFLIASSHMIKNNLLDEKGRSPNDMFIMNVLDFLNNREGIAIMRSKEQRFNPLNDTGPAMKTFIKSFNIAGLPALVVLFGLLVWVRRHSRKKRIQTLFQN